MFKRNLVPLRYRKLPLFKIMNHGIFNKCVYQVVITEKAVKALQTIPKMDAERFIGKLDIIANDPYADLPFLKRLKSKDYFRFRFGDYRGVYIINNSTLTVTVIDVAHRKDIYRR